MRFVVPAIVALSLLLAPAGLVAQKQLKLIATVTDPGGAEVTTIDAKDVRVLENGTAATVVSVEPIDRVPKVQVLLDNGIGMPSESIGDLRKGVRGLLEALPPDIEVTVVTTAPQPRFLVKPTTNRQDVLQAVDRLAPDTGAGRFVESLFEATQRIERDKQQDASYVLLSLATSSGDLNVRDRDVKQIQDRVIKYRPVVHVVHLTTVGRSASAGVIQGELGQIVAKMSGGRYENINVANRLATLLPELGGEMAKILGKGSKQFRITVERPGGASGELGQVSASVAGKILANLALDAK